MKLTISAALLLSYLSHVDSFSIRQKASRLQSLRFSSTVSTLPCTSALPPYTFAGLVEQAILDRFGPEAQRVVESWRLLDQGYEHREFVGSQQLPPIANSEESNCHQLCHSFVPGLPAKTFWDVETFEWVSKLKSKYKEIKKEFTQVSKLEGSDGAEYAAYISISKLFCFSWYGRLRLI